MLRIEDQPGRGHVEQDHRGNEHAREPADGLDASEYDDGDQERGDQPHGRREKPVALLTASATELDCTPLPIPNAATVANRAKLTARTLPRLPQRMPFSR